MKLPMKRLAPLALVLPLAAALALPAAAQTNDPNRPTITQLVAQDEARIAQLKANLRIAQDQESEWGRFETALKDISKKRAERRIALMDEWDKRETERDRKPMGHIEALRKHADALTIRGDEIRAIADAAEPFSEKLNPWQRQQVDQIIRTYVQTPFIPEDPRRRNY
jgi:hypothetical protein